MAGILHDFGKVLHRGDQIDGRAHSVSGRDWIEKYTDNQEILDCIRYHHHQDLDRAGLNPDHPAYAVYIADNIASGLDRREIEGEGLKGFDKNRPQESIYNLLNNNIGKAAYQAAAIIENINYPQDFTDYNPASDYNKIIFGLSEGLQGIDFKAGYVNSLLELAEAYLSYVPSSTYLGEVADISLFDHSKLTAALAACIVLYLESQGRNDYRLELFQERHNFYREKAFCLFSCDISGIQQFIYTISSKGALKGLRSRSFYLELLLENLADEIVAECGLYRCNLIYSGGGHAYILLPNTDEARDKAVSTIKNTNLRLLDSFGTQLFVGYGLQECCGNELMSKTEDPEDYSNIFCSLASQVMERKLRRYSAAELRLLNRNAPDRDGRECKVCGVSSELVERDDGTVCRFCSAFTETSRMLIKKDSVFVVAKEEQKGTSWPLFSSRGENQYFYALPEESVKELLASHPDKIVRVYSKNTYRTGLNLATRLWLGDYAAVNNEGDMKTFAELAQSSEGIKRIGVLRADVDNMGAAFVSGFVRQQANKDRYRYLTLSRTATLSRSLSIFFKYYLNGILTNGKAGLLAPAGKRNIVVVYAGGDDLFLVGAWNEVLAAALDIRRAFDSYTGHTLTMSAGLAIFEPTYPIARMAAETAALEDAAKKHKHPGGEKDAISLFGLEMVQGELQARHTYNWDSFEKQVLGEKYRLINELFSINGDYGNTFLYNIIELLRQAEYDSINIARLAYLLSRREPKKGSPETLKHSYSNFARTVYSWAMNPEDRNQLITAILIYVYYKREEKE
ncbi:type III-A CRISPR-associated protein Cas10/Csm1 [Syntrophomonas palmitatica]|uniref:type III-A CRISPR-associated protein Cas10/Csm1 n=1 Tax=Syntrophomonas palmitatica TaxID=402877 RepID=UPI000AC06230|nr:type III-A CRISPR-associated protein Cas10/Csm1 [Syntrophomonas palmitatica]